METCKICLKKISGEQKHPDYHNTCLTKLFSSTTVNPTLSFTRQIFSSEIRKFTKGMSISGVQKKLSIKIVQNQLEPTDVGGTYILKPTVEDLPELAQNEHLSMLIGNALDIETPPLGLLKFADGELVYIIKRFDWRGTNKAKTEDLAAVFDLNRNEKGTFKYEKSYEEVALKLKDATGGKLAVVLDFFNRLVFNYLIENNDYHLKNISVISEKPNRLGTYDGLTPNYDSVMTRIYMPEELELALDLLGGDAITKHLTETGHLGRPDFDELGTKIGLSPNVTSMIFDKINKKRPEISALIDASFLSSEMKIKYRSYVNARLRELGLTPI